MQVASGLCDMQWTYLCSPVSVLWLFGFRPLSIVDWATCAALSISSFRTLMFCSCFSRAICSCCSFSSSLCCAMIWFWAACLFSNLPPGDAERAQPPPSCSLCRALQSWAAVGAACRRVTCHGWAHRATVITGVFSRGSAEASGAGASDLWWSSWGGCNRKRMWDYTQQDQNSQVHTELEATTQMQEKFFLVSQGNFNFLLLEFWHINRKGLIARTPVTPTSSRALFLQSLMPLLHHFFSIFALIWEPR